MSDYIGALEANIRVVGQVPEGEKSPFPPDTLFFHNPFDYLHSFLQSEIVK
mgnify:CR=1 FL=1